MNILRITLITVWLLIGSTVMAQPIADFSANVTAGCGSLQVSFQDESIGNITSYSWDLGGVASTTQHPGRIFGTPGSYEICLTVTDNAGLTDTACKTDFITVFQLPVPDFTVPNPNGCVPFHVTFEDLSTSADGNITEWIWGLGGEAGVITDDGSLPAIENRYDVIDEYTISLTVMDDNGCTNTITKDNFITVNENPVVSFIADEPFSCTSPHAVSFLNTSPSSDMTFRWDFGNGQSFNGAAPPAITYNNQGVYTVTLFGTDNLTGCQDTMIRTDYIRISYPTAFSASADTICMGSSVSFIDESPDPANSVFWDFGDGNTSTATNPTHQYDSIGCFFVILTRTVNGCPGVAVSQNCITVNPANPVTIFNDNPFGCTAPHEVNFTSNASNGTTYEWNFGDGQSSIAASPTTTFDSTGQYTIQLQTTNEQGCIQTTTDTIKIVKAQAIITEEKREGCVPLTITINEASETFSPITSWEWTIYNNSFAPPITFSSTDTIPEFTLVDTGRYDIRLVITDQSGCRDTTITKKGVSAGMPPSVNFSAEPLVSCINSVVTFTDESSNFANGWEWDFGDGGTSQDQNPVYEYRDTGVMDISLTALHHSCPAEHTLFQYIEVVPPKAAYQINRICDHLYKIDFVDRSIGADSIIYDFGVPNIDTDTSSQRNPSWTYVTTGDYLVSQIAFNFTTGCSDTLLQLVQITEPKASFLLSDTEGCLPLTINLSDSSSFAESWIWTHNGSGIISDTSAAEPTITFDTPGPHTSIQLLVTDVNGCQDSLFFNDTIFVNEVTTNFTADPLVGCAPFSTNFTDASSSLYGTVNQWDWNFGDQNTNTSQQNPAHTYEAEGYYNVSLTATDDKGCSNILTLDSLIEVTQPVAAFSTIDTLSCSAHAVRFANTSNGKNPTYRWDFGDGTESTEEAPTHNYIVEGTYTVCLTITDSNGCTNTVCRDDYVVIANPLAAFTQDTTFGICPPLVVNFENTSSNATAWEWDFGDQSGTSNQENPPHVYTVPGKYNVSLIAIATEACRDTLIVSELIELNGPVGSFHFDIDTACAPAIVTFVGNSPAPYTYIWDYGNGMLDTTENVMYDSLSFIYREGGDFIPKLILIDDVNCQTTIVADHPIVISSMIIDFQADRTLFCDDAGSTKFTNLTTSTHLISELRWNFEGINPEINNAAEPLIQYLQPGSYNVQLLVDNGICRDTLMKEGYIGVGAIPEVGFLMSDSIGCAPLSVNFIDTSSVVNSTIDQWQWRFNEEQEATLESPVYIFNEIGIHTIQLIATSAVGCSDSISRTLEVLEVPEFSITTPESICKGQSALLVPVFEEDTTGYTYQWVSHPDLSCTNCLTPMANPLDTTTYQLSVTNPLGCSSTESVTVDVRPFAAPIITLTPDTSICLNDFVQLRVSGGADLQEYQWDTAQEGLSCYDACINPVAKPITDTRYTVTVTNEFGCATTDSVLVTIKNQQQPVTGADEIICKGDQIQLTTLIGRSPTWLVTDNLTCTYCPDPVAQPDSTTNYRVQVITDDGCTLEDTVQITVIQPEDISAGMDQQACSSAAVTLTGQGTGIVQWSPAAELDNPDQLITTTRPTETTTYVMTITNGNCTMQDSVEVLVTNKTALITADITICEGDSVALVYEGLVDQATWYQPNNDILSADPPLINPVTTTTYSLIGNYSTCEADTASLTVNVIPEPERQLIEVLTFLPGNTLRLPLNVPDSVEYDYAWTPAPTGFCTDCQQPEVTPDSTISYQVAIADMSTGCMVNDTILLQELITCPSDLIFVPNAFSPNDDGQNDRLRLFPNPTVNNIKNFRIFDRWGGLLYETSKLDDLGWDGKSKGKRNPMGVYIYMLEFECELTGKTIIASGDITLIR